MPSERILMRGSDAMAETAIRVGCRYYFGYPITPQNEVPEYMSEHLPKVGGTFIQAESEIGSINMVVGAAACGARVMTSSSSPGISLMQEGISYMAGLEIPAVIANMMRGGPGLGNIAPSQADYFQCTRGGGNGDYRTITLAPASVQELSDLTGVAFDLADKYRNPVVIAGDGLIGQMMEPVILPDPRDLKDLPVKDGWKLDGCEGREPRAIYSLLLEPPALKKHNEHLDEKIQAMVRAEQRHDTYKVEDAELLVVAYGTSSRVAKGAINRLRQQGVKVGLFRPITLWPFPRKPLKDLARRIGKVAVLEMSLGQLVEDVSWVVGDGVPVYFYGVPGGMVPDPAEAAAFLASAIKGEGKVGRRYEP